MKATRKTTSLPHVPMKRFGKDHWSTLGYVETCVVDKGSDRLNTMTGMTVNSSGLAPNGGQLNLLRMRCNEKRHPLLKMLTPHGSVMKFKPEHSTRLRRYFSTRAKSREMAQGHDDWDCLQDMERHGLLEIISTVNGIIVLTAKGLRVAALLRQHKASGGNFADFGDVLEQAHLLG